MSLSNADLTTIASKLFLMQKTADMKLPVPKTTTGASDLSTRLDFIGKDPTFKEWGIGVIDFTADKNRPIVWLQHPEKAWRIGSTGKIAIILAAAQLRADVRAIQNTRILTKPEDYDALFAMDALWRLSSVLRTSQIASEPAPRISTIFDFSKTPVDFQGPGPADAAFGTIIERLATKRGQTVAEAHLTWPLNTDFAFTERLWLAGTNSDNIGADSCMSEIGVAYVKAIQRGYGLFDDQGNVMRMLLNGPYSHMNSDGGGVTKVPLTAGSKVFYRDLQRPQEMVGVADAMLVGKKYTDMRSWEAGSAAALTAYMIAFVQKKFAALSDAPNAATDAATGIESFLSHGDVPRETVSYIAFGVGKAANITKQVSKLGLLNTGDLEKGALNTEFVYLETQQKTGAAKPRQYGVVVTGITDRLETDGSIDRAGDAMTQDLGKAIHDALAGP